MASDEFIASVEHMVAHYVAIEASIRYVQEKTGKIGRDDVFVTVAYRAIRAAMEMAKAQLAVPRTGTMTFDEAMKAVSERKICTFRHILTLKPPDPAVG
ncbi:MAG TPA: hypothetical protein VMG10_32000 [Gemmataceae bacterium]|nr:hypothetical protein [Gemmataceae bacterium]